ncbi:hypothetical protein ACROYT_G014084 [Oculina patagonica]
MAGVYDVPFTSIAPRAANTFGSTTTPRDTFMDMVRCIRALIYSYLYKLQELCEVPKLGDNKDINRQFNDVDSNLSPLSKEVKHQEIKLDRLGNTFKEIVDALQHIHEAGGLHIDIKEKNILKLKISLE